MANENLKGPSRVVPFDAEMAELAAAELREDLARAGLTEDQLQALRAQFGELHLLRCTPKSADTVVVVARRPDRAIWRKLQSDSSDAARKPYAPEAFVRACIVHPDAKAFDAILSAWPGLVRPFSDELLEIAGVEDGSSRKV